MLEPTNPIVDAEKIRQVVLVPHDTIWTEQFHTEASKLQMLLADNIDGVYHIGSTAIPNIYAKPTIDILIAVNDLSKIDSLNPEFEALGYSCMDEYGIVGRRFYWKGTSTQHTYHIHLFEKWHHEMIRHLTFRDYLRQYPDIAQSYSWLKRCLAEQFPDDIKSYVNGKDAFIRMLDYRTGVAKQDQLTATDTIQLKKHDPKWKKLAMAEINTIIKAIHLPYISIEHLGSTAVKGLLAKPVIDIFIALESMQDADRWIKPLEKLGYLYWYGNPDKSHYRFVKGMPPCGIARTHHVHVMPMGDDFKRRVAFRDKLRGNVQLCQQYAELKVQLAEEYTNDREAYTEAKTIFINNVLKNVPISI